ncbi:MAG: DUF58 domain-containing protein [Clostridiales bacterium]|nr:DUF58 domain-containing protein [Clostridiales bacterium]
MWVSWILLIVILMIPVLSLIMSIVASRTMKFHTDCQTSVLIGTPTSINITTSGLASYFSFCRVKMTVTDHMTGVSKKHVFMIHDNGTSKIPVDTRHCGSFSYRLTWLSVYDLFGLFHINTNLNKNNEIFVKPVPSMPERMPNMYGFKAKNLRRSKQPTSEIYDIRDYQIGDPLRSIHWKMSAKKDELLVKEPLEEYGGHSRVLLKLTADRDELDLHLGQILFTSRFFIEHETAHRIRVIPPDKGEVAFEVESETDLERAIVNILRMRIPKESPKKEVPAEKSGDVKNAEEVKDSTDSNEEAPHED